jgi:hypothetical protein
MRVTRPPFTGGVSSRSRLCINVDRGTWVPPIVPPAALAREPVFDAQWFPTANSRD